MYTRTFIISIFISLGFALPMFPVARPYIPSGLGPLPSITTNAYIVPRAFVNTKDEIVTGPIPDKWKHTHGVLSLEIEAEKRSIHGSCAEGVACAGLDDLLHDIKDRILNEVDQQVKEEINDRAL